MVRTIATARIRICSRGVGHPTRCSSVGRDEANNRGKSRGVGQLGVQGAQRALCSQPACRTFLGATSCSLCFFSTTRKERTFGSSHLLLFQQDVLRDQRQARQANREIQGYRQSPQQACRMPLVPCMDVRSATNMSSR